METIKKTITERKGKGEIKKEGRKNKLIRLIKRDTKSGKRDKSCEFVYFIFLFTFVYTQTVFNRLRKCVASIN